MVTYNATVGPPGFTATAVAGAPKRPGESWSNRRALRWDPVNRYWRTGTAPGQAYADGSALSAATTANIKQRPLVLLRRGGRMSNSEAPGLARLFPKAAGVAITAGVNVLRQCDPTQADYGQCYSAAGTGRRTIGTAAIAAASADSEVLVWMGPLSLEGAPHVPLNGRVVDWPFNSGNASRGGVTATSGGVVTLDATSAAAVAGDFIYRGHNGEITASQTAGGAGKTFLGRAAGAAAPGGLVEVGWFSNRYETDMNAWLGIAERLDCVLFTSVDMSDSVDVTTNGSGTVYEVERTETPVDDYFLTVLNPRVYRPSSLASPAVADGWTQEICCDFPFSQLPASFSGILPSDLIMVMGSRAFAAVGVDLRHATAPGSAVVNVRQWRGDSGNTGGEASYLLSDSAPMPATGRRVGQGLSSASAPIKVPFGRPRRIRFYATEVLVLYSGVRALARRVNPDATTTTIATLPLSHLGGGVYCLTVNNPTYLHALEDRATFDVAFERFEIASGTWIGGSGRHWLDPLIGLAPPWRIAKQRVAGDPTAYRAVEGYLETGLDWPEPSWSNSLAVATATVGTETQLTWSGTATASVTEPGTDRALTGSVSYTLRLYDPTTKLWFHSSEASAVTYTAGYWNQFAREFSYSSGLGLVLRFRNPGPTTREMQWTMSCIQSIKQRGGERRYLHEVRGTVNVPVT